MTRNEFKNQVVNHLSRLSHKNDDDVTPIRKHFPWYADLVNFLLAKKLPSKFSKA
ncbi:hypothetical protein Peur_008347 [Populus x canadensis]